MKMRMTFPFFVVVALLSLLLPFSAQTTDEIIREVKFRARIEGNRLLVYMRLKVSQREDTVLEAVKVTYEPSGIVPVAIYREDCPRNEKTKFLAGARPLSSVESPSLQDLSPEVSLDAPKAVEEDYRVKIEYLAVKGGVFSTGLAARIGFDDPKNISFSVGN